MKVEIGGTKINWENTSYYSDDDFLHIIRTAYETGQQVCRQNGGDVIEFPFSTIQINHRTRVHDGFHTGFKMVNEKYLTCYFIEMRRKDQYMDNALEALGALGHNQLPERQARRIMWMVGRSMFIRGLGSERHIPSVIALEHETLVRENKLLVPSAADRDMQVGYVALPHPQPQFTYVVFTHLQRTLLSSPCIRFYRTWKERALQFGQGIAS